MGKGKSLFVGFLVGSVVAAATTLVTTPKTGGQLRKQIIDKVEYLKKEGKNIGSLSKESIDTLKEVATDVITVIDNWKDDVEPHKKKLIDEIKDIQDAIDSMEKKITNNNENNNNSTNNSSSL
jgi:gas vesicle protein